MEEKLISTIKVIDDNAIRKNSFKPLFNESRLFSKVGSELDKGFNNLKNKVSLEGVNLLFIHSGNTYCTEFVDEACRNHKNLYIILYSGGNSVILNQQKKNLIIKRDGGTGDILEFNLLKPERVFALSRSITEASQLGLEFALPKFFESNYAEFISLLDQYDPVLEAKLELLHQCLDFTNLQNIKLPGELGDFKESLNVFLGSPLIPSNHLEKLRHLRDDLLNTP